MEDFPRTARAVVIGGGIIGCSTAYHLARLGWTDTVLLERRQLTSGSTFHAAGLVGQLRSNANVTRLLGYSIDLYRQLETETGFATGWKMNGGLRLACCPDRMVELRRQATLARAFGLPMEMLSAEETRDLWPAMDGDDLTGAAYLPTDGQVDPTGVTMALARAARMAGVRILENVPVDSIEPAVPGSTGTVVTPRGRITCGKIVCCAGLWTQELVAKAGGNVPIVPLQHQYIVTLPIDGLTSGLPTLRDPDRLTYFKEDAGKLVVGGYEPDPVAGFEGSIPEDFHFGLLPPNTDRFEQLMEPAVSRVPALGTVGIRDWINGPESFTPDGNFILGEVPGVSSLYVGAGFNAFGIASGGGAGMALAEWVHAGEPPFDLWPVDIRRFGEPHGNRNWVLARTQEAYGRHYAVAWPHREAEAGRPFRVSALHDDLKRAGACLGEKLGWERANWIADLTTGESAEDTVGYGRQHGFAAVGRESRAARKSAILIDQSSFAKFVLSGKGAEAALAWIAAGRVTAPVGKITVTPMLNDRGGIEADVTVTRLGPDRYYIVSGTGTVTRDFDWLRRTISPGIDVSLDDVTLDFGVLSLMGPNARKILANVCAADVSADGFPFGEVRSLDIAGHAVTALRLSYIGELGWELHLPVAGMKPVFGALLQAGHAYGLRLAGYRAIESLRLEMGNRSWGSDIGPDTTPLEAGLGWSIRPESSPPFKGHEAIERQRRTGLRRMLVGFSTERADISLYGGEAILRNGEPVGWLTSGGHGHTVHREIGYGYVGDPAGVDRSWVLAGDYELEVACDRIPVAVHPAPILDRGKTSMRL